MLSPAGSPALAIAEIGWVMIGGATLLFVATMALLAWAVGLRAARRQDTRGRERPATARRRPHLDPRRRRGLAAGRAGRALPVRTLSHGFRRGRRAAAPLIVSVIGHDWWWELRYRDPVDGREIVLANEIHLPAGRSVVLGLNSGDVIHSFWVPALAGKVDMIPGRVQQLRLEVGRAGAASRPVRRVLRRPARADGARGRRRSGAGVRCLAAGPGGAGRGAARRRTRSAAWRCSARRAASPVIRSAASPKAAPSGPDLTHVASRRLIGAGVVAADEAGFARWIGDVQHLKPGARMPEYSRLDPAALAALASLLGQLQ